jgi:hypothetical protein
MFDSAEEKAAKKQAREEEEARVAAAQQAQAEAAATARRAQAWQATPAGGAVAAKVAGDEFYEIQLQVGSHDGRASWGEASGSRTVQSSARSLGEIERVGWRLEHVNHVFMATGESSTGRVMLSGENTAVSGAIVGIYLFRNDRAVEPPSSAEPPADFGRAPAGS